MAAVGSGGGGGSTSSSSSIDGTFKEFIKEVKEIEKKDAVLTNSQQIDRLLRPGSKYSNLNPYDVLMIEPDTDETQRRKAYRKLSFLVHPDKNLEDKERAQKAFEAVNKAYKMFDDEEQVQYCMGVAEEAREMLQAKLDEKRKLAKKEGKAAIEEDDPVKYKQLYRNTTTKLFADLELKKQKMENMEGKERKRQRDEDDAIELKASKAKEWKHDWEATQTSRVDSWRSFQKGGKKKKTKSGMGLLKPPKLKQEKR